ncbi:cation:proton antiporter [Mycoplasmatota bacterium]|nr:cation:proton antiporter [Mycoplasmatota bacterium]
MIYLVFGLVGTGVLFSILRLIKGPTLADRAVAVDTLNIIVIGIIALVALIEKNSLFLDIAIVYAILAFLETVVFARFVEGKHDS